MSFADILANADRQRIRKISGKIPGWEEMEIPGALALEQCSSNATAEYKARFVHGRVADLTGGLGVDSSAFSRKADALLYNEADTGLFETACRNFKRLGVQNMVAFNMKIQAGDTLWREELERFRPDIIYLDPSRRDAAGRKVFLLEECSPDIVGLMPGLLELAPEVMVKISPMADISLVVSRLGNRLREIHIVGSEGECKELLCLLDRSGDGFRIVATDLSDEFIFTPEEERECNVTQAESPMAYLYEPGPVLMKAGAFKLISRRFGAARLDRSTNLYFTESPSIPLGKCHRIIDILPFSKQNVKNLKKIFPEAEVSARNIPLSSNELRSRLGVRPSNRIHIFGCSFRNQKVLIVTGDAPRE